VSFPQTAPRRGLVLLCALAAQLAAQGAVAQTGSVSVGAEYASGDYGYPGKAVEDVYIPVNLEYRSGNLVFNATLPYVWIHGPEGSVIVSDTILPGEGPIVTESGLGDIIGSITVRDAWRSEAQNLSLDVTGTIELGTADEDKGLGTGKTDYSVQATLYHFAVSGTVFGGLGYKVRGDPPGVDLKDTWFAVIGGAVPVSNRASLGASVGYRPEIVSSGSAASELTVYLMRQMTGRIRLRGHVLAGLASASPDWGAGFTMQMAF
jgi:hypothetical protein